MIEKNIENYLKEEIEKRDGICIKLDSSSEKGLPDRLCILPYGKVIFIETKRPQKNKVSKYQNYVIEKINSLGSKAYFVSTKEEIDIILKSFDKMKYHFEEAEVGDI